MVVVALLSVDLVESIDLVSVLLVVNCTSKQTLAHPYFFGYPVFALRDHTLRYHNAYTLF